MILSNFGLLFFLYLQHIIDIINFNIQLKDIIFTKIYFVNVTIEDDSTRKNKSKKRIKFFYPFSKKLNFKILSNNIYTK